MSDSTLQILLKLKDDASSGLQSFNKKLEDIQQNIRPAADASKSFAVGLGAIGVAAGGFLKVAIDAANTVEQQTNALTTMIGSATEAQKLMADISKMAAKTPFEQKDLIEYSKQLIAMGSAHTEVINQMQIMGNIAAGVGMDKLPQIVYAFGQVQLAGRLMGQDLMQFTNAGVPLIDALAKSFNTTAGNIKDMVSKGQIGFKDVEKALASMTAEGGKFSGLMDSQSETFGGLVSTLQDSWNMFLAGEGKDVLEWAKELIRNLTVLVTDGLPKVVSAIKETTQWFKDHSAAIYIVSGAVIGALVPSIISAAVAFGSLAVSLAPFLIGGAIIGALVAGIVFIVKHWNDIKQKASEIWGAVSNFIKTNIDKILLFLGPAGWLIMAGKMIIQNWDEIKQAAINIWNGIKDFFVGIWEGIKNLFKMYVALSVGIVITVFEAFGIDIVKVFNNIKSFFSDVWEGISSTFKRVISTISSFFDGFVVGFKTAWSSLWNGIKAIFEPIINGFINLWRLEINMFLTIFNAVAEPLKTAWSSLWDGLSSVVTSVVTSIKDTVKGMINFVFEKINALINALNSVAQKGAGAVGLNIPKIPTIPLLAAGGIVTRPTLAVIGEAGPEAVVPLNRYAGAGGIGGATVVLNVNNLYSSKEAAIELANEIAKVLRYQQRI